MTISYQPVPCASDSETAANVTAALDLGLPDISSISPKRGRLAIVGGGPSINHRVHTLRTWKGDVWAINGAAVWCERRKIKHTLFACDPLEFSHEFRNRKGPSILALGCHPQTFAAVDRSEIVTFDASDASMRSYVQAVANRFGPIRITTAFTTAAVIAGIVGLAIGYDEVTYFGCESCYPESGTHAYKNERVSVGDEILVACGDKTFLTRRGLVAQAVEIASLMRQLPIKQRCGGLVEAVAEIGIEPFRTGDGKTYQHGLTLAV